MPWLDGFDVAKALQEISLNGYVLAALTACAESNIGIAVKNWASIIL